MKRSELEQLAMSSGKFTAARIAKMHSMAIEDALTAQGILPLAAAAADKDTPAIPPLVPKNTLPIAVNVTAAGADAALSSPPPTHPRGRREPEPIQKTQCGGDPARKKTLTLPSADATMMLDPPPSSRVPPPTPLPASRTTTTTPLPTSSKLLLPAARTLGGGGRHVRNTLPLASAATTATDSSPSAVAARGGEGAGDNDDESTTMLPFNKDDVASYFTHADGRQEIRDGLRRTFHVLSQCTRRLQEHKRWLTSDAAALLLDDEDRQSFVSGVMRPLENAQAEAVNLLRTIGIEAGKKVEACHQLRPTIVGTHIAEDNAFRVAWHRKEQELVGIRDLVANFMHNLF